MAKLCSSAVWQARFRFHFVHRMQLRSMHCKRSATRCVPKWPCTISKCSSPVQSTLLSIYPMKISIVPAPQTKVNTGKFKRQRSKPQSKFQLLSLFCSDREECIPIGRSAAEHRWRIVHVGATRWQGRYTDCLQIRLLASCHVSSILSLDDVATCRTSGNCLHTSHPATTLLMRFLTTK